METKFIEATNGPKNWGKFAVMRFDSEWLHHSMLVPSAPLLNLVGWSDDNVIVFDLQTGEGVRVRPGGSASADLNKHRIWVCPLFEPFLAWLYKQDLEKLNMLPDKIDLPDAPFAMHGYRREGEQSD